MKILKKFLVGLLAVFCVTLAFGCGAETSQTESSTSETPSVSDSSGSETEICAHELTKVEAVAVSCTADGNVEYYECSICNKYFADETAITELPEESITILSKGHSLSMWFAKEASCTEKGNVEYYECSSCEKYFADRATTIELSETEIFSMPSGHSLSLIRAEKSTCTTDGVVEHYECSKCDKYFADETGKKQLSAEEIRVVASHDLTYVAANAPVGTTNGNIEHWFCAVCENNYADAACKDLLTEEQLVVISLLNIPDFLVEVETGRDPVVLQLSDPQIMYSTDVEDRCYKYIRETVQQTKPDLILVTGDLIYGQFDTAGGSIFTDYIAFMESFKIPWAPVFGNHDNECPMGVDWQCQKLEEAKYCLFKQGELTGNGNYSVGLAQGGELLRVFYMLDSNGCGSPSAASVGKVKTSIGFGQDQINWYTNEIRKIHAMDSEVKISFAYHIQQGAFRLSFHKYSEYDNTLVSGSSSELANPLNLDTLTTADDTDFGFIGRTAKGVWDSNNAIFNGMKTLGVDSIFVGHEHCNSSSIVYQGVRFQYGQKSSTYDRYNWVLEDGTIKGGYTMTQGAHPLIGGTVIPVSSVDGSIGTGYIYYCENPFDFEPEAEPEIPVNGLQYGGVTGESALWLHTSNGKVAAEAYTDANGVTANAYKVTSGSTYEKLHINPKLLSGKTTVSFTILVTEEIIDAESGKAASEFAIRIKTTSGTGAGYIHYDITSASANRIEQNVWTTVTVDISAFANECTEFSIYLFGGENSAYVRDIAVT